MAVLLNDIQGLQSFDCSETTNLGIRWERWLRAFEFYADGKGVEEAKQKKALLLHSAGMQVQDVFHTLAVGATDDLYEEAVKSLNTYFKPKVNVPFERHLFRSMEQKANETVEQYITRLKSKATTCDFGADKVEEQIRDQVIEKCFSHKLRLKLLEKGKDLKLDKVLELSRAMEQAEAQASAIEGMKPEVNKLSNVKKSYSGFSGKPKTMTNPGVKCFSCGHEGHRAKDSRCPAIGKQCRFCRANGHFESCCRKKMKKQTEGFKKRDKPRRVRQLQDERTPEDEHAFVINSVGKGVDPITIKVGGVTTEAIIDSGASCNVMDRDKWEKLKTSGIRCISEKVSKPLYAYGRSEPLPVAGIFWASVKCDEKSLNNIEFIVIEGEGQTLLGHDTATKLGVLHIGPRAHTVDAVTVDDDIVKRYPECFTGFGKLNDFQLHIPIDKTVRPIAQPLRRIPFNLREPLERKLQELEELDIIERVNGPSSWVSPVVVIPKDNGDIRLCLDMRVANGAVLRERHPIPTIDEVLHDMNESSVFSKLDIEWAYHQVELDEKSREITTFVTHKGLYRYKRLMFGISCAPEMYQKVMSEVLQECEGVNNIMDDIVVHAKDVKEHDARLDKVLCKLRESGLTLNRDKCSFHMNKITFMGHVLSEDGIGPTDSRVRAVQEARRPETAAEVRSFLGLVNFSARFIPNLSTLNEPLHKLTKKGEPFCLGCRSGVCFSKVERLLSRC